VPKLAVASDAGNRSSSSELVEKLLNPQKYGAATAPAVDPFAKPRKPPTSPDERMTALRIQNIALLKRESVNRAGSRGSM
jgi:hypothetical protein